MQASIREMKNRLSQYIKRVRAGREVVITDRGKPVARLVPVGPEVSEEADIVARTLALPWVRPGKGGKPKGSRKGVALRGKGPTAAEIVLQDRE
jgi:prevent-host-death family protein